MQVESGVKRFYLIDQMFFDSLFDLIQHYQSHPLRLVTSVLSIQHLAIDQ